MKIWVLPALIAVLGTSACMKRFVRVTSPSEIRENLKQIEEYNSRVSQLKAAFSIKGIGILGHLFHEQADIIVQKPDFLLWQMRSFFDVPASMIASDGRFITIYDWTDQHTAVYEKIPLDNNSLIDLFDFKIHPRFLISLLLAQVPLSHARALNIAKNNGLLEFKAELDDGFQLKAIFEEARQVVLQISLINSISGLSYDVQYDEIVNKDGILFPTLYNVKASNNNNSLKFAIRIKRLELNGPPTPADKFFLRPQ